MVTVDPDPDRDLDVLSQYITSFISDAEAVGTSMWPNSMRRPSRSV